MKALTTETWHESNQRYLSAALKTVRQALESHTAQANRAPAPPTPGVVDAIEKQALEAIASSMSTPPALETLSKTFRLSPFEQDVLLLCAGVELDGSFAHLCAAAQGDPRRTYPTFSLALAALPDAHWSALTQAAPLRHWNLIEVRSGDALTSSPLAIDERVLHYLVGISHLDERLSGLMTPVSCPSDLPASQRNIVHQIVNIWAQAEQTASWPVLQLCGDDSTGKQGIAASAAASLGFQLHMTCGSDIPTSATDRIGLCRLWEREAAFGATLLVDCDDAETPEINRSVVHFIENIRAPVILTSAEPLPFKHRSTVRLDTALPNFNEQVALWHKVLLPHAKPLDDEIKKVVAQFNMGFRTIQAASADMLAKLSYGAENSPGNTLWEVCRAQWRPLMSGLAQRIEPVAKWDDIVLPNQQLQILHEIAVHNRHRTKVYDEWGFASKSTRGLGISALFVGASGTGKTMAAEVLANELQLDLYRIDLSQVISKYIGETEKNLRRVFDAAEGGGAILLFDEADALFGKRSEVKDSHDRYANIEVSYLLQRMEAYRGLSILTTNMKEALDPAFIRRIRFIVHFPFPDQALRAEIWRRVFPRQTPTEGLEAEKLAHLNVAGGNIRNIAMNAAFVAADRGEPVKMLHVLQATRAEYTKLEKPLTDAEIAGWAG